MFTMSVIVKPLMDLIPVWQCDRNWSKIIWDAIPNPVHDLKVKVTDVEFFVFFVFFPFFIVNEFQIALKPCLDETFTPDQIQIRSGSTVKTSKFNPN